ncbi:Uncharacterized protein APZ42_019635 [Daphnia magna]|uniref:Uncharacterized protein n=1 Tax=Daphnia magna TaxID=35525 RepID=A0A164YAL3_9CRUS|nr:Uncharacterized protein APZ42_019635 [Daphnia magna]
MCVCVCVALPCLYDFRPVMHRRRRSRKPTPFISDHLV